MLLLWPQRSTNFKLNSPTLILHLARLLGHSIRNYLLGRLLIITHSYLLVRSPDSIQAVQATSSLTLAPHWPHSTINNIWCRWVFRNISTVMSAAGLCVFPKGARFLLLPNQDCTCCMSQMQSTFDILPEAKYKFAACQTHSTYS